MYFLFFIQCCPHAKQGFCRSSPTVFSDCPKYLLKLTANLSQSGNWILLSVHEYSDSIIDTTGINKFSLVKWPLTTILYYEIKVASPCCLFMLQVLHKSIMPYHSAWHYIFLYVSCLYIFFFMFSNIKSNINAIPKQVTSILHIPCGFA
jgi:hypothetical protein